LKLTEQISYGFAFNIETIKHRNAKTQALR
jgi:hypothetical protein